MAAGPEPPEWEPRWRKALRGKENKGSVEIMRKDLNDARDLHGQAESAAAVWKGHVMDRRKKALTDYKKLRTFFVEEEERFLQEAEKEEGSPEDEDADPAERFRSLLQALSDLERRHRNLGLNMLLQILSPRRTETNAKGRFILLVRCYFTHSRGCSHPCQWTLVCGDTGELLWLWWAVDSNLGDRECEDPVGRGLVLPSGRGSNCGNQSSGSIGPVPKPGPVSDTICKFQGFPEPPGAW
ncbi:E3 ubiquitin-protein ligase RNF187 isoform X1 [Pteropus alecto]|nr:E3 ubiquitin-protein ligase RNF187 isoform X1 [Pteropus alecto]